jgi:hypothetical protein
MSLWYLENVDHGLPDYAAKVASVNLLAAAAEYGIDTRTAFPKVEAAASVDGSDKVASQLLDERRVLCRLEDFSPPVSVTQETKIADFDVVRKIRDDWGGMDGYDRRVAALELEKIADFVDVPDYMREYMGDSPHRSLRAEMKYRAENHCKTASDSENYVRIGEMALAGAISAEDAVEAIYMLVEKCLGALIEHSNQVVVFNLAVYTLPVLVTDDYEIKVVKPKLLIDKLKSLTSILITNALQFEFNSELDSVGSARLLLSMLWLARWAVYSDNPRWIQITIHAGTHLKGVLAKIKENKQNTDLLSDRIKLALLNLVNSYKRRMGNTGMNTEEKANLKAIYRTALSIELIVAKPYRVPIDYNNTDQTFALIGKGGYGTVFLLEIDVPGVMLSGSCFARASSCRACTVS